MSAPWSALCSKGLKAGKAEMTFRVVSRLVDIYREVVVVGSDGEEEEERRSRLGNSTYRP